MLYYVCVNNTRLHKPYRSVEEAVSFINYCCSKEDNCEVRDETQRLHFSNRFPGKDWDKRTSDD